MVTSTAFSLIELCITLAIMAMLAALLLVGGNALGIGSKRAKTETILGTVRTALALTVAHRSSIPAPAEHPLAASKESRPLFVRTSDGSPVATTGLALIGVPLTQVQVGKRNRVLLSDDVFADADVPHLFGVQRERCSVLAAPQVGVTRVRRLPPSLSVSDDPDVAGYVQPVNGDALATKALFDHFLGLAGAKADLVSLGALRLPETDFSVLIKQDRVVTDTPAGAAGDSAWEPGRIADGNHPTEAGKRNWKRWRIPAMAVLDAWGHEILYAIGPSGAPILTSAGADGSFHIDPGEDHSLDTTDPRAAAVASDRDGSRDNLVSKGAE